MWFYTLIIAFIMTVCIVSTNKYDQSDKSYTTKVLGDSVRILAINFVALYLGFYFFGGKRPTDHQIHTGEAPF